MSGIVATAAFASFVVLTFVAWRRYLWAAKDVSQVDTCPYGLTDVFEDHDLVNVPHQKGARWLTEIFSRSARKYPDLTALQIPHTGESLTFAELDVRAEKVAAALSPFLTGPDQVVAVAMSQDNWQIVAAHLGVLKAGGTLLVLDTTLPDALITHMLDDARPVVILTRGQARFRDLPTLDVLMLPERVPPRVPPRWLDDPTQRLATLFYTSGTTGMPKGVECPHAGYVNLALSYADYFDLLPGMDATTLTSSLGYDGSISEMYSAWVSGCAVVMLTKEQVRSGPDLVPVLREAEVTLLFCPPVLLTTLTPTPEIDLPYPLCRYIVPAGEAFPGALVEPWTRGRRQIINTYGPTEASTDTSRQSLRPGEPITIGSPFPNVTYVILDVEQLRPLPHGEIGELCIGGVHVARGYRNLPEETARKFITHPQFGRLYRTGDKCRIDIQTQRVHFLGRIDAQLKVRGHRVEVQAVEDILQTQFDEIEAAVLDYQNETLVAFVAAPSVREGDISLVARAPTGWAAGVKAVLAKLLPPPSIPTRIFLVEKFVMKPVSGKIDRTCLPNLSRLLRNAEPEAGDPCRDTVAVARNRGNTDVGPFDVEAGMAPECDEVLAICRSIFETPLGLDDGFVEAGAHSITIARLAQRLQAAGWAVPVRALLGDCNTARKVASRLRARSRDSRPATALVKSAGRSASRDETAAEVLSVGYFTTLQVLFAIVAYSPALVVLFGALGFLEVGEFFMTASLGEFIVAGFFLYLLGLAVPFATLLWVMIIKFFMGGHIRKNDVTPGVYPKWSRMHLRTWCIGRLEDMVLLPLGTMYRSAPLMAFVLRAARRDSGEQSPVRARCFPLRSPGFDLHRGRCRDPDRGLHPDDQVVRAAAACRPCSSWERLQNRDASRHRRKCDGRPRQLDHSVHSHSERRGFAGDVGRGSRAPQRSLHEAQAPGDDLPIRGSDLAAGEPQHPHANHHVFLSQRRPCRGDLVVRPRFHARGRHRVSRLIFQDGAAVRGRLESDDRRIHHDLGHDRRYLLAGLPLHSLHGHFAGTVPIARPQGSSPDVQND